MACIRPSHLRVLRPQRSLHTTTRYLTPFSSSPAPPRLPADEQARFEALQRASTGAFSTPTPATPTVTKIIENTPATMAQVKRNVAGASASAASSGSDVQLAPDHERQAAVSEASVKSAAVEEAEKEDKEAEEQIRLEGAVRASGDGEELHPHVRRGAKPEFEGDTNPKTGEVGGPKNEPLRWGAGADWSYNGRVTDF